MSEYEEIWAYLPADDELDPPVELAAEEAAVHVDLPAGWRRVLDDPGRCEVTLVPPPALAVADDEDDGLFHLDEERELDVEELLERQHYAFALSADED